MIIKRQSSLRIRITVVAVFRTSRKTYQRKKKSKLKEDLLVFVLSPKKRETLKWTLGSLNKIFGKERVYVYSNELHCKTCFSNITHYDHFVELGNTYQDDDVRVQWRTSLVCDYVKLIDIVLENFHCTHLLTSENDVLHDYSLSLFQEISAPFSLYDFENRVRCRDLNKTSTTVFSGGGALCFYHECKLLPQLRYYLLGNANLKPLDWLISDFYHTFGSARTFNCNFVSHQDKTSTLQY